MTSVGLQTFFHRWVQHSQIEMIWSDICDLMVPLDEIPESWWTVKVEDFKIEPMNTQFMPLTMVPVNYVKAIITPQGCEIVSLKEEHGTR